MREVACWADGRSLGKRSAKESEQAILVQGIVLDVRMFKGNYVEQKQCYLRKRGITLCKITQNIENEYKSEQKNNFLKLQNNLLSKWDLMRNQCLYYQTVLFIYVVLFLSYGEICSRTGRKGRAMGCLKYNL